MTVHTHRMQKLETALRSCRRTLRAIARAADAHPSLETRLPHGAAPMHRAIERADAALRPTATERTAPRPRRTARRPGTDTGRREALFIIDCGVFRAPAGARLSTREIIAMLNRRRHGGKRTHPGRHLHRTRASGRRDVLRPGARATVREWDAFTTMTAREARTHQRKRTAAPKGTRTVTPARRTPRNEPGRNGAARTRPRNVGANERR